MDHCFVGKPQEPDFDYTPDSWYDSSKGFDKNINYSKLRVITPKVSKILWESVDKDFLHEMRMFTHNVQRTWEIHYGVRPVEHYIAPNPALALDVEYFGFWVTADDRLRYIAENITTNPDLPLIDQIGNGLASHFYGARNVHKAMNGIDDPKTALVNYSKLAEEQIEFKTSGIIGEYTLHMRSFLEEQKKKGEKLWGTTELHTSIQTAGRRWLNEWYNDDRLHQNKGSSNNVNEWIASFKNSGLLDKMVANSGLKSMCDILGSEWGIGDYYRFHGGSDLSLCPELNAYIDERYVVPGPGATWTLKNLYPDLSTKDVSLADRVIWFRENQSYLLGLPEINPFFHKLEVNGINIFPEPINEIKTTQAEVCHCQFGIYVDLRDNPHKIDKRKVARNDNATCAIDSVQSPNKRKAEIYSGPTLF
jgi:hypothetical protein